VGNIRSLHWSGTIIELALSRLNETKIKIRYNKEEEERWRSITMDM
jgi:hypothetical protein